MNQGQSPGRRWQIDLLRPTAANMFDDSRSRWTTAGIAVARTRTMTRVANDPIETVSISELSSVQGGGLLSGTGFNRALRDSSVGRYVQSTRIPDAVAGCATGAAVTAPASLGVSALPGGALVGGAIAATSCAVGAAAGL